jgi:16S rRNA (uracil1498-N3)-methyltransferase
MRFERFFLREGDLEPGARVRLDDEESRHIGAVLRKAEGGTVTLFNGDGREARARVLSKERRGVPLEILEVLDKNRRPPRDLELVVALPRGGAADDVVRRALETGASRITPLLAARSVHRPDRKKDAKRRERFERLAIAVMKLSGRNDFPHLDDACEVAKLPAFGEGEAYLGSTRIGPPHLGTLLAQNPPGDRVRFVVGPEGGFSADERRALEASGHRSVSLGSMVLRVETAVAVAVATLAAWPRSP